MDKQLNTDPTRARNTLVRYMLYINLGFAIFHFAMGINAWIIIIVNALGAALQFGMAKMEGRVEDFLNVNPNSLAGKVNKFAGKNNG